MDLNQTTLDFQRRLILQALQQSEWQLCCRCTSVKTRSRESGASGKTPWYSNTKNGAGGISKGTESKML
ncbi:MAG TPA: hypothetical protein DCS87_16615 [Rheinheimera sp.]|nr:hypothetical protein [Rheinheimera sp.]